VQTYVLKRLLLMVPTLFGVSIVVWAITASAPEPPVAAQKPPGLEQGREAGDVGTLPQSVKVFRAQYGLDKPAVINTYYDLETAEVEQALRRQLGIGVDEKDQIKARLEGTEKLIAWGYYAVPALVDLVEDGEAEVREVALAWFFKNAERVTTVDPGQEVDEETAARNAVISGENRMLKAYAAGQDDPESRKEAAREAVQLWYEGAAGSYGDGVAVEAVRRALISGEGMLEALGHRAVPGLVRLILDDEHAAAASRALVQAAVVPVRESDPVAAELAKMRNTALAQLEWPDTAPAWRQEAGRELVKAWWEGARLRWDYSGLGWLRVMLLETQFANYWGKLLRFDLGYSSVHKRPVIELILERLKYSLTLAGSSLVLSFLISVPLGLASARWHGSIGEKGIAVVVFILYSLPSFFVATLMIRYLARGQPGSAEVIPVAGFQAENAWELMTFDRLRDIVWHVAAPIFCMTYASLAALSRYAKTGLLNVIRSDYVRTARAKGLSDFVVTYKHAARNGIIPVITLLGTTLPVVVGGSFVIEFIFKIPGFGLLMVESVYNNDYNVIVGNTLIVAVLTMIGILLSDLLYAIADPRISFS